MSPLDLGFLCSLDSLAAGAVLGLALSSWGQRWRIALMFGLCDAAASWAARYAQAKPVDGVLLVLCLVAAGWLLARLVARGRGSGRREAAMMSLPLLLSLDNLLALSAGPDWVAAGIGSAAMAMAGLCAAPLLRAALRHRRWARTA